MEKEYFLNTGIQPPLHFEPTMQTWNSFSSAPELNCSSDQTSSCFLNPNWDKQTDHFTQLQYAFSSMVSSPVGPTSAMPNDALALRELIGKLGPISNTGDISPPFPSASTAAASSYVGNNSANTSCYSTPLNSPPKIQHVPILNQFVKENLPNLANSVASSPPLPALSSDPGFAERAAKFSCFGSRSFNGRTNLFGSNNDELPYGPSTPTMCNWKLTRVSSSPSLNQSGSPMENKNSGQPQFQMRPTNGLVSGSDTKFNRLLGTGPSSNEDSSVSELVPSVETGSKNPTKFNSRKRKAVSRGKAKEDASTGAMNANKGVEADDNTNSKRLKPTEANASEKSAEETKDDANKAGEQDKAKQKPPEPPKDYIHVRARRGQATDSHSLAERVRREKISERMKLLQDLVPGCNKVTGKALMLDEIINYVQSLQRQVEFLSMKLASVNPTLDFNMENLISNSKDIVQSNAASLPHPSFPVDSSLPGFYNYQPQQNPQLQNNGSVSHCSGDPVYNALCRNLGLQLPQFEGFGEGLPQFPQFCEDDLQNIVQMGLGQDSDRELPFHSQSSPVTNRTSHMKIEL